MPEQISPKQRAFLLATDTTELFYGGAAGGAKSIALLLGALQYVDVPGYAALIVRRTFPQLSNPGGLMQVAYEWLGPTDAHGVGTPFPTKWTFPSGATLTFGHIANPGAVRNYQGAEFHYIGVDECTDFDERTYTFLFSRLRRKAESHVPTRFRAASNPAPPGLGWVRSRYVDPETARDDATFMPAHLWDNPFIDQQDYIDNLERSYPLTWHRLLYGDWEATESGLLFRTREWLSGRFVAAHTHAMPMVRYWDMAASEPTPDYPNPDWTVGTLLVHDVPRRKVQVADVVRFRKNSGDAELEMRLTAERDGRGVVQGVEQEPGASGKQFVEHVQNNILPFHTVVGVRPTGNKEVRARPPAGAMKRGKLEIVTAGWNRDWMDELDLFDLGDHDDQVDSFSGAWELLAKQPVPRQQSKVNRRTTQRSLATPLAGRDGRT